MRIAYWMDLRNAHAQRWAEAMADRGHDVHVLSSFPHPDTAVAQYPLPEWLRTPAMERARVTVVCDHLRAPLWARRIGADVYHLHSFLPTRLGAWSYRWPRPLVVSVWGSDAAWYGPGPMPRARQAALRRLFDRAAALTLTTDRQRAEVAPYLPPGLEPVVIPWGVDAAAFQPGPLPVEQREPVVGYLKGFYDKYGPDVLVEAIPAVAAAVPEARFRLMGGGPLRATLEERVRALGVSARVAFLDPVPKEQVARFWDDVAVGVVCSRHEAYGVACLETQACAVPVVVSDIPGLRDTAGPGSGTVAVPPDDPRALADALIRLLRDPAERARLGAQGPGYVRAHHRWRRAVDAMEAVYERARERRRGGSPP